MQIKDIINLKYSDINFDEVSKSYNQNQPFPHINFSSFFKDNFINEIADDFPDLRKLSSYERKNINEKKFGISEIYEIPEKIRSLILFLNSSVFLEYVRKITGIKETLIPDPYFYGGGLHQIYKDGYLKVHSDFYLHPKMKLDRRLNILIYLNQNWKEEYGGALELWDEDLQSCKKKIYPNLNNVCIFSTDHKSYHGHPNPLNCPEEVSRNSIALYYYTNGREDSSNVYKTKNTTIWKNRKNFIEVKNEYNFKDFLRKFKLMRNLKKIFKK